MRNTVNKTGRKKTAAPTDYRNRKKPEGDNAAAAIRQGGDIKNYRRTITLLDGRTAVVRPICSEDKAALVAFHGRLSSDSLFLRYHYSKGALTESDLTNFCDIDYVDNLALVTEIEQDGRKDIIGVGRYCRLPGSDMAEVAFVVQDSEQKKGIGTMLLKYLAALARERNIRYFYGEVLRQNSRMISIFRKCDPTMQQVVDDHTTCTVTISVDRILEG